MAQSLADVVLAAHFVIAAFITSGFLLIPIGAWRGWRWVRNRRLRLLHLAAIAFVAAQALVGLTCPLTLWEDLLRGTVPGEQGFIERWVGRILYWNAPPWVFTATYAALAGYTWALWRWVAPEANRRCVWP